MSQPPWMAEAWAELGLTEKPGTANNQRVLALFHDAGHSTITSDATAWCAAFTGAALARAGFKPSGSLLARSYLGWGEAIEDPRPGAIAIFSRTGDPSLGHVGFWLGETQDQVLVLGGNQSNAVTVDGIDRSRLLGIRWPHPNASSSRSDEAGKLETDIFETCLAHVLTMEGGYSDDPYDPGGPTNKGITLAVYARSVSTVVATENRERLISQLRTIDNSTVRAIYRSRYWQPSRAGEMPAAVALMHFDASVNHGVTGAARLLQSVLDVETDGEIGPITMSALGRSHPLQIVSAYASARRDRYRTLPHFWRFGNGWLNRVNATERRAIACPTPTSTSPTQEKTMPETTTNTPSQSTRSDVSNNKWWGESLTVWGALLTAVSTVLPIIGPLFGLDLTPDIIRTLGDQTLVAIQAIGGVVGTLMTILGRARATTHLSRRSMTVQL